MADMVQNALRRKLAAAQAVGDVERIGVLRRMLGSKEAPAEVPANVPAYVAEVPEIVEPTIDEATDPREVRWSE